MKKFSEKINPEVVAEEKYVSILHLAEMNLKQKIGAITTAAVVGGSALGLLGQGGRQAPKAPDEPQPRLMIPHPGPRPAQQPAPAATPADQPKAAAAPAAKEAYKFSSPEAEKFYHSVVQAEHRGNKALEHLKKTPGAYHENLSIRTRGKNSTAYGQAQITLGTIQDMTKRHPDLFQNNKEYVQKYIEQGKKFKQHINTKHPVYGRGGKGDLYGEEHHDNYMAMADGVIQGMMRDAKMKKFDVKRMTERWRGVPHHEDTTYHEMVFDHYNSP